MRFLVVFSLAGALWAQDAKDFLNQGVQAFRNARYPEAVEAFQKAVAADPNFATAHLYLATAYMQQFIPGAESAENAAFARNATEEFLKVLTLDPNNKVAIASLASLELNQKLWDEALTAAAAPPLPPRRVDWGLDSAEAIDRTLRAAGFAPERVWSERLPRQWDAQSFFALASTVGPGRQRLAGLSPVARSQLLRQLRKRLDQLPSAEFLWEGTVICAVAAKEGD